MMSNNGGNSVEWRVVGSNNKGNDSGVQAVTNSGENGGTPMQVEALTLENGENSDRTNVTVINDAYEQTERRPTMLRQASLK
jgi:hypothetical protein